MSREENPQDKDVHDLSELEAALAALVPRADRLNRDRLMFLAGQASAQPKIDWPPVQAQPNVLRPWANWAWPAAFAAMTGVAASLLLALAIRPGPQIVERMVERIATPPALPQEPAVAAAQDHVEPDVRIDSPATAVAVPDWLVWGLFLQPAVSTKHEPSYRELRDQALLHGLEPWKPWASTSAVAGRAHEERILSRQDLNRWLEQEGVESASPRIPAPTLRNPLGAKS